jgi:hypothetical protein
MTTLTIACKRLTCANCGAPVGYQAPFCSYCRTALLWDDVPVLGQGGIFRTVELWREPLPGKHTAGSNDMLRRSDGVLLNVPTGKFLSGELEPKFKDVCIAASATCLDPGAGFGVTARMHEIGSARSTYALSVRPGFRAFTLTRLLWTDKDSYVDWLLPWECVPAVAGVGTVNHIELRVADSVLQVVINGVRLATVIDARFGFGTAGWRAVSFGGQSRVVLHQLEARRVA